MIHREVSFYRTVGFAVVNTANNEKTKTRTQIGRQIRMSSEMFIQYCFTMAESTKQ